VSFLQPYLLLGTLVHPFLINHATSSLPRGTAIASSKLLRRRYGLEDLEPVGRMSRVPGLSET